MNKAVSLFAAIDAFTQGVINPRHIRGIARVRDVSYGTDKNQTYDILYADAKSFKKPLLINIHGGGFLRGDKRGRRYICELFAERGWFVMNVNYRTAPKVQIIDECRDVWTALADIEKLKDEYGISTDKIVITGDSAGAYLAAYMVALSTNDALRKRLNLPSLPIHFDGLIPFCGVYDFEVAIENHHKLLDGLLKVMGESLTGMELKSFEDVRNYEYYDVLNIPQFINNKWCPVCMCYSEQDLLTRGQGEAFREELDKHRIPLSVHYTTGMLENHCYHFMFASQSSRDALDMVFEFLEKIKGGGA